MKARQISLKSTLSRRDLARLVGERPSPGHFDAVVDSSVDAYDVDTGRLVFRFRKGVLDPGAVTLAREIFGDIDTRMTPSYRRKSAAGKLDLERIRTFRSDVVAIEPLDRNAFAGHFILESGKRLRLPLSNPVLSYIAGYTYNRYTKVAGTGGFSARFPDRWRAAVPFFDTIGECFSSVMPSESTHMRDWCRANGVLPRFTIGKTCLSTVAINVNYESCYHFDQGDLPTGYSTLTALGVGGDYRGGELVFPQFRIAVDVRDGDLLCNQSHLDLHGNTAVISLNTGAKRISFVTYLKKLLKHATKRPDRVE